MIRGSSITDIYKVQPARPSVLLALTVALFATPSAPAGPLDFQAVVELPRASNAANGEVIAWRNIGVRAASEWFDAEAMVPTCLTVTPPPLARNDASTLSCAGTGTSSWIAGENQQASLTFKVPRWDERLPSVDLSVRQWRSALIDGSDRTRRSGVAGALLLTQPLASFDAIAGYEQPLKWSADSDSGRTVFMGVAWRSTAGIAFEIVGERSVGRASGAVDRSLTFRLAHRFDGSGARIAAWCTRSFDDSVSAWRSGLGVEFLY